MTRRCSHCGRFVGRYLIVTPRGLACPPCGPRVDGGAITANARAMLLVAQRAVRIGMMGGLSSAKLREYARGAA